MNRLLPLLIALPVALILCCSGLENPFDSKSANYVSDTTLVRIMHAYDSTVIDTTIVFDTIVHVDTVIHDSIRIVNKIHYDTTYVLDTLVDTIHHRDTTIFIDTVIHYDTSAFFDTLHVRDTLHFWDTLFHYDTLIHVDTVIHDSIRVVNQIHYDTTYVLDTIRHYDTLIHVDTTTFRDTIHYRDTVHFRDTLHFRDTVTHYDTLIHWDTLTFRDTIHYKDTIHFRDTLYHYDTLVHRDTVIDTIRFYRTQPFIYLVKLPDSSVFNTFNYGASYSLAIKAAGINPAIIRSYSYMPEGGSVWNAITLPWARTYNTTSPVLYTLRISTDSGNFANSYTLRCNPSSAIRGSAPVFSYAELTTDGSFFKAYHGYVPVCTLWTDSTPFSIYPDRIDFIHCLLTFDLSGGSLFDIYVSRTGSYDTTRNCVLYDGSFGGVEFDHSDMYPGTNVITAMCRATAPDTSLWSPWLTMVFIVRDGR